MQFFKLTCPDGSILILNRDEILSVVFQNGELRITAKTDCFTIKSYNNKDGDKVMNVLLKWLNWEFNDENV